EGKVSVALGGSFEPNKLFTVTAQVDDPVPGQRLTLDLPPGMERVEGKEMQVVPPPSAATGSSLVLWKAKVLRLGQFPLRVRSSTGVTQTKNITISRPDGREPAGTGGAVEPANTRRGQTGTSPVRKEP